MIIAITAYGETLDAPVCGSFERARWFIFYDTDLQDVVDVADNPELELPDGGGLEAAEVIVGHDTEVLITGDVDPEAGDILAAGGVQVHVCTSGSVRAAIELCLAGELPLTPGSGRGIYPGPGSPETPHSRPPSAGNDPGREETNAEVIGVERECMCLVCGHTQPHEEGAPACEDIPCPHCGARMHTHLKVE